MNKLLLLWLLPIFVAFERSEPLSPVEDVPRTARTDYYSVEGSSVQQLSASMKSRRPFDHNAYTAWYIDWNYSFSIHPDRWELREFDVRVQIRYTLPQWKRPTHVDPKTAVEWERFLKAVVEHEKGHANIGLRCASEIKEVINFTTWEGKTRDEVKKKVDAKCKSILARFKALEARYDEDTDHGRTQGARLGRNKTNEKDRVAK